MKLKNLRVEVSSRLVFLLATLFIVLPVAAQTPPEKVETGKPLERQIKGGETREFEFKLKKGEFARAEVIPTNIDVIVSLIAPDGKILIEMDGDSTYLWRESVSAVAEKNGTFKLQVKGKEKTVYGQSSFIVRLAEQRKSVALDTRRIEAEKTLVQAVKFGQENKLREHTKTLEASLILWREIGDKHWVAITMWNLAYAYFLSADYQFSGTEDKPLKLFNQALPLFQNLNDRSGENGVFHGIGSVYRFAKKYDLAKENLERALVIRRELKRLKGEYNSLNALNIVYYNLKQNDKVLESQNRMLEIAEELNDKQLRADTLKANGDFYREVYSYKKAFDFYKKALFVYQELEDKKNEISVQMWLGLLYGVSGDYENAKIHLERYAELSKEIGAVENWTVYYYLGLVYYSLQQYDKVLPNYEKALELAKAVKDNRKSESSMMSFLGSYYVRRGELDKGRPLLEEALKIARVNNDWNIEQATLWNLADLHLKLKEFEKAENYSEQSLAIRRKNNKYDEGNALNSNGVLYLNTGKYEKAKENFLPALDISREIEDKILELDCLNNLGLTFALLKQYEEAGKHYSDSLEIARKLNNQRKLLATLNGFASVNNSQSKFEEAKKLYEEVIKISDTLITKDEVNTAYNNLANVYINLGDYQNAKEYSEKALKLAQVRKEQLTELIALTHLGMIYSHLSQYDQALEHFEKVLKISQDAKNPFGEYDAITGLGFVYINLGKYDKAKEMLEKAEKISQEVKTINPINISFARGAIYTDLSDSEKATAFIQQSLEMAKNAKNRSGEGIIISKLAEISMQNKKYEEAKSYYEQSLAVARDVKNTANASAALISLGEVYLNLNKFAEAKESYEKGLELARKVKKPANEGYAVNGLGELAFKQKEFDKAHKFYQQALPIAKETQLKKLESRVLKNLMEVFKELKKPQAAIVYGKQAVNIFQEIRGNIRNFEKESQQSYLKDKETAYRTLADLLIAEDRFFEAQAVLNLLKEEEFSQLARTGEKGETIPYSDIENSLLELTAKLAALYNRQNELLKIEKLSDEQSREYENLRLEINAAHKAFDDILKKLTVTETSTKEQIDKFFADKKNNSFNGKLANLQKITKSGVVGLYTLIGKAETAEKKNARDEETKFGWVILVTEKGQRAYPIDVKDFNQTVFLFRDALGSDKYNPQIPAEKLYNAIFRQKSKKYNQTLEQDLQRELGKYQNKTLMWSLDGVLRYIPIAALHDGKNYLAEKYLNTGFTEKSVGSLGEDNQPNWKILGLGVSEPRENFTALPGVKIELETIVREGNATSGILNGAIKLNNNFKKGEFFPLMSKAEYPVVHIASHYSFNPTEMEDSFLLVGDGRLTFRELQNENDTGLFGGVDLLTLSACDTGVSGNGKEAEGFPIKAQELGAKSVIASLWKVSDAGTPELMIRFYKLRAERSEMSKGEAFRQAQMLLIYGETKPDKVETGGENRTAEIVGGDDAGKVNLPLFVKNPKKPFAHPHYWSSFVLIGNWR